MQTKINTEVVKMRADKLKIHPTAQRKLSLTHVKEIESDLDVNALGVLHAVKYTIDGTHAVWVFDGQHTLTALINKGFGSMEVDVKIHHDAKDPARASELFLIANKRKAVRPMDKYIQGVMAKDLICSGVENVLDRRGLKVDQSKGPGVLRCTESLKSVWERDQGITLGRVLDVITNAWGTHTDGFDGEIVKGLGSILAKSNGNIDPKRLSEKLSKDTPNRIIGRAKALQDSQRGPIWKNISGIVLDTYNHGRSEKNRVSISK